MSVATTVRDLRVLHNTVILHHVAHDFLTDTYEVEIEDRGRLLLLPCSHGVADIAEQLITSTLKRVRVKVVVWRNLVVAIAPR